MRQTVYFTALILFIFLFTTGSADAEYIGYSAAHTPSLQKERKLTSIENGKAFYLLRYMRSSSPVDGKFLLVDADLNVFAETPYVYNIYAQCTELSTCYFFNFSTIPFPARNAWQVDTHNFKPHNSIRSFLRSTVVQPEKDLAIIKSFITDDTQKILYIDAMEKDFTRGASMVGLKPAPAWVRYVSPLFLLNTIFIFGLATYFAARWLTQYLFRKREKDHRRAVTLAAYSAAALTLYIGLSLLFAAWTFAPFAYSALFTAGLALLGFSFKQQKPASTIPHGSV